jgi:long-subunit fatty acid transport protein
MEPRGLARVLLATTVLCCATEGRGAGFEFPTNGTQALGRGAAFTAKADDLTAIEYNIAGLAKLKGTHFLINLNLASQSFSFARSGLYPTGTLAQSGADVSGQPFPVVHKKGEVYPIPIGGVSTDFGLKRFTFALGINGPSSMGRKKFPEYVKLANGEMAPAPQRFELLDEDILIGFLTVAAAWRPLDWLHVGAAFQYTISNVKEHVYAITYLSDNACKQNGEYAGCSTKAGIDVWDWFIPTGIVSALVRGPHPKIDHLELGVSGRIPFAAHTKGSATMSLPPSMEGMAIEATGASLTTKMPGTLRTGLRWFFGPRQDEKGDVEVDFVWEGWSRVRNFLSTFSTNLGTLTFDVPHYYKDTFSVRTGGSYNLKLGRHRDQRLMLRAGFFWESAAAPQEWSRLDFDAFERFGATVGAGYKVRGITFNMAFAYIHMPTRDVTNSKVTPIYPPEFSPPTQYYAYIGNGRFESRMWVLSLGAAVSFDELLKRGSGLR